MKASPLEQVKKSFGDRAKLLTELAKRADRLHGEATDDEVKARLGGLSNRKLLRLLAVEEVVRQRFGDREKLVAHILDARKKAGLTTDEAFQNRLGSFSKARLLDLTHQKLPTRPAKQTPTERLANKRGKKERQRALSKLGKA